MPKNKISDLLGYFDYGYIKFHKHKIKKENKYEEINFSKAFVIFLIKINLS